MPGQETHVRRRAILALIAAAGLGLVALFLAGRGTLFRSSDDSTIEALVARSPFRNVDPAISYISDALCADCHASQARTYAAHSMGRSLLPVSQAPSAAWPTAKATTFEAFDSHFFVEREGRLHRRARIDVERKPIAEQEWPVDYVIGSGARGHSYLTNRAGYLFQTPASWYAQPKSWDLSPGFGPNQLTGRPVLPECLFCHADRARYVEGSVNRYSESPFEGEGHSIGCQRCHGPGEAHVAARQRGEATGAEGDFTIVNPSRLEWRLREAVCEQCHFEGESRVLRRGRKLYDYRPGLPLELFWSVVIGQAEAGRRRAVGHVEQMYESQCFQGGDDANRLGCISCHDPHKLVAPAERAATYRQKCLTCHERRGCSLPSAERLRQSAADSCVECHMPRYTSSDIPHTASTDHRIPRRKQGAVSPRAEQGPLLQPSALITYLVGRRDTDPIATKSVEAGRDLAVAVIHKTLAGATPTSEDLRYAGKALEEAVVRHPHDLAAGEARGFALGFLNQPADALAAFRAVLSRASDREQTLAGAGAMAEATGQAEAAREYWQKAIQANPYIPEYRRRLTGLLVKAERWEEALVESQAWLRLDPMSVEGRLARMQCLLASGMKEEARAEFARIEGLKPANLEELRIRFARRLR